MTFKNIINTFKNYRKTSMKEEKRKNFLRAFEKKMIYRTTKTENPKTTKKLVQKVLSKFH